MTTENISISAHKPPIIIFAVMFIFGLSSVIGLRYWQINYLRKTKIDVTSKKSPGPTPVYPQFTLMPPSSAAVATISALFGDVQKRDFQTGEPGPATESGILVQGESLFTGELATASVSINNQIQISLEPQTEINFVSLMPGKMLFKQPNGLATYTNSLPDVSISVRSLGELILFTGSVRIDTTDGIITINQLSGKSDIAFVDNSNITNIYHLKEKQRAIINDSLSTVRIR